MWGKRRTWGWISDQYVVTEIEPPDSIIRKTTADCMKSGIIYSNAAAMDRGIGRMEEELGEGLTVIATGGLASRIIP